MNGNNDHLAEELRREAASLRPQFSREVHREIMDRVRREGQRGRWQMRWAAAAIALIGAALSASSLLQNHTQKAVVVRPVHELSQPAPADMDELVSAQLWPPQINLNLPVPLGLSAPAASGEPQPAASEAALSAPQWMLAALMQPASDAADALSDSVPEQIRDWAVSADQR